MERQYDVTSVGVNPAEDRAHRMRVYFIAMTVRVACVASLFFVRGWWVLLVGLAAIVLPYFAVLVANQAESGSGSRPDAPTPLELTGTEAGTDRAEQHPVSETLLVVDAPADRRSQGASPTSADAPDEPAGGDAA